MAFYQRENSIQPGRYDCRRYSNYSFATHLHRHPEMILALSGEAVVSVGTRCEVLHPGEAALILPHELHAFSNQASSELIVTVFSADYVPDAFALLNGKRGLFSVFRPSQGAFDYARSIFECENASLLARKSALYALCAAFAEQVPLISGYETDEAVARVLAEMSEHACDERLTLSAIAEKLGYEKHYLSRRFNRTLPMNFRTLLTHCRLDTALSLLREGRLPIEEIARRSGFASLRALDRACLNVTGLTPSQWKNQH